jgi:hypothetical protein
MGKLIGKALGVLLATCAVACVNEVTDGPPSDDQNLDKGRSGPTLGAEMSATERSTSTALELQSRNLERNLGALKVRSTRSALTAPGPARDAIQY